LPPGKIGASAVQRQWIGLSLTGDEVTVEQLPPSPHPDAPSYLQSVDIEVSFLRPRYETAEQFSADEMTRHFIKAFSGVVMAVEEILVVEFHGHNLKAIVKAISLAELADKQRRGAPVQHSALHDSMGVLMDHTDVNLMKSGAIKIKASAKKCVSVLHVNIR
jgi:vesicle-fusing ATPase